VVEFAPDLVGQRLSGRDGSEDENQKQQDILDIIHVLLVQSVFNRCVARII
jgi:hypothetical protein